MEDEDNKLKTYYKQTIDSIELDYEKENNKNPKQVNEIVNFLNSFNISSQEEYKKIIADFISSRIYDNIISHKPDEQDKKIFNILITGRYKILTENNETNIEQKIFNNMIMSMKKYIHFKGVYQKAKAIKELFLYFAYYSNFSKGKQEGQGAQDDNITNFIYTISKIFPKNLFLITKYAYLFYVGKDGLEALKYTLLLLTKENIENFNK